MQFGWGFPEINTCHVLDLSLVILGEQKAVNNWHHWSENSLLSFTNQLFMLLLHFFATIYWSKICEPYHSSPEKCCVTYQPATGSKGLLRFQNGGWTRRRPWDTLAKYSTNCEVFCHVTHDRSSSHSFIHYVHVYVSPFVLTHVFLSLQWLLHYDLFKLGEVFHMGVPA